MRNPRTGSDYRHGDDYTMPMYAPDHYAPDHYSPDHYAPDPYAPDPYAGEQYQQGPYVADSYQQDRYAPDPYAQDPYAQDGYGLPGQDGSDGPPPGPGGRKSGRAGKPRKHGRIRRFFRLRTVRAILAVLVIFLCFVAFSLGRALTANNGLPLSAKLAEWARDHYLGSVVTLMEQLSYQPPKSGGKPQFSLTGPQSKLKFKKVHGFKPDVPKNLSPFASPALPGEGAWRLQETVRNEPALFTTFMRVDSVHTSYVAGIASFDQRLVKFQLRPGSTDPGSGFGGAQPWIAPGTRTGLLATFNGGFRLNSSRGGFYLNGRTSGSLTSGAASVVYFCNGTVKIGQWGRDVGMTKSVCGVRQNLELIIDHGQISPNINQNVEASFGATLGGAYYVWRSGIGQTKDGRIVYVYGPELSAATLANLLQRAGAVEGMELDINPEWTTFEYYHAAGHPTDPAPVAMLPDQPSSAYRYYSVWARDFTAVYAR
ncbi:MAG TPA: phosphodiester glycosidase family protein [Streptosporangiaceae bacterium]